MSKRVPHGNLPVRSTTALRQECKIPYRIDLAGGWHDQPYVSKYAAGSVLTICIEPDFEFNDRSGMSTSSRKKAIELWQTDIPDGDKEKLAKTLFCFENPPGTNYVSGSQDSLGITMPGLNKYLYDTNQIEEIIELFEKYTVIKNHFPEKGRTYSLSLGFSKIKNNSSCFIQNIDNPEINSELLNKMLNKIEDNCFVVPVIDKKRGHPVLLGKNIVNDLKNKKSTNWILKNELKLYKRIEVDAGNTNVLLNLNTPEDWNNYIGVTVK